MPVRHDVEFGRQTGVSSGAWATVVSLTPVRRSVVTAFSADLEAELPTSIVYRVRLQLDGATKVQRTTPADAPPQLLFRLDVNAGSTVTVDVFHDDVSTPTFAASIAYEQ